MAAKPGDLAERLSEIAAPTLVISGDSDQVVSPKDRARVAAVVPNASFVIVAGAGHLVMEEQADSFVAEIERFLVTVSTMQPDEPNTPARLGGP